MVYDANKTERSSTRTPAFERRLMILKILSVRRFVTIQDLADRFSVSRRTIQYDIDYLSSFIPVYSIRGRGGGFRVLEGWRGTRLYLTDEQERVLTRLIQVLPAEDREVLQSIVTTFAKPRKE